MKAFTVHMPPDLAGDAAAERAAFVKDGFCWPALFIPVLWLLWHRLWLVLVAYLCVVTAIGALQIVAGEGAAAIILIAFALYFAAEANNTRRWSLGRRGWTWAGEAFGRGREDAELRYFTDRERQGGGDTLPVPAGAESKTVWAPAAAAPTGGSGEDPDAADIVGLFPEKD
ncbi:MAG TPA: DUF2628 domain-containing protein [Afifellaceae bacterium]|nr:DUF2628 domain-containing protein [Afifellaceae bacterium]